MDLSPTPRLTDHARRRCREMGIATRVAKQVVRDHTVSWTDAEGRTVATSDRHPEVTVVYACRPDGVPQVVTVLWREPDQYDRATYVPPSRHVI